MRVWWNSHIMGGDTLRNRFELALVRPSMFQNYVFYRVAHSYGDARERNVMASEKQAMEQDMLEEEWQDMQSYEGAGCCD
jgi:hypothetical protein